MKRLGALVIGDEILAGHVHESNTHWLAQRLKTMGITLARVEICTDDLPDVTASVRRFLRDLDLDYVITSGGLGPTPDDRTMQGIADAIGATLELTDERRAWMQARVAEGHRRGYFAHPEPNEGILKMGYLPAGAKPLPNLIGTALGAAVTDDSNGRTTTLYTLPGVPAEFKRMFDECVAPELETAEPLAVEELVLYTEESRFFPLLRDLETEFPGVAIGSYPHDGSILLRATGPTADAAAVMQRLRAAGAAYLAPPGAGQASS